MDTIGEHFKLGVSDGSLYRQEGGIWHCVRTKQRCPELVPEHTHWVVKTASAWTVDGCKYSSWKLLERAMLQKGAVPKSIKGPKTPKRKQPAAKRTEPAPKRKPPSKQAKAEAEYDAWRGRVDRLTLFRDVVLTVATDMYGEELEGKSLYELCRDKFQ